MLSPLSLCQEVVQLDQMIDQFSTLIFRAGEPCCDSPTANEGSVFPAFFPAVVISYFLNLSHSYWSEMKLQSCFICLFLIVKDDWHFLRYSLSIFISSSENSLQINSPFFLVETFVLVCLLLLNSFILHPDCCFPSLFSSHSLSLLPLTPQSFPHLFLKQIRNE